MQVAWRTIINEINTTADRYMLCVSGGVDSMFLLDFFIRKCKRPMRVAHFDHKLRPTSAEEGMLVRSICESHGIEFLSGHGDPDAMRSASSLEAEARNQRYGFFERHLQVGELLVTGHHADDQVETVIMRLMRGYPDNQLRMHKVRGNRYKPFLSVPKSTILEQAQHRELTWIEDKSNADTIHERNWVRHVLVPQMMERRNVLKTIGTRESVFEEESEEQRFR